MTRNFIISEKILQLSDNCAFPKCSTSRKDKLISLPEVPTPDKTNNESIERTKDFRDFIIKYRVKGESMIKLVQQYKLHVFERHFIPD